LRDNFILKVPFKFIAQSLSLGLENIKEQSRKQMGKNAKAYSKNAKAQASVFYLSKP
jgi:ribosome recycling factor